MMTSKWGAPPSLWTKNSGCSVARPTRPGIFKKASSKYFSSFEILYTLLNFYIHQAGLGFSFLQIIVPVNRQYLALSDLPQFVAKILHFSAFCLNVMPSIFLPLNFLSREPFFSSLHPWEDWSAAQDLCHKISALSALSKFSSRNSFKFLNLVKLFKKYQNIPLLYCIQNCLCIKYRVLHFELYLKLLLEIHRL